MVILNQGCGESWEQGNEAYVDGEHAGRVDTKIESGC